MQTKVELTIVDARAFEQTLLQLKSRYGYGLVSVELNEKEKVLQFTIHRYAMDGNGYHVGYEVFTTKFMLHSKSEFEVYQMAPYNLSEYFLFSHLYTIDIEPAEKEREYTIDDAIQYLKDNYGYDDSDINELAKRFGDYDPDMILQTAYDEGMGEGDYFPPDEDFANQEISHTIEQALNTLVDASFDSDTRTWTLGEYTYKVGE